jgi:hypothetical protein
LVLVLLALVLSSCGPSYKPLPEPGNRMVVTVPKDYADHLMYQGQLPKLIIPFTDAINVTTFSSDNYYILTKNDDLKVSGDLAKFFSEYESDSIVYKTTGTAAENDYARLGGKKLPLDGPSFDYNRIITTNDGTRFSMQYRMFTSGGVVYYGWTYSNGIAVSMEMPFMVSKINDTRFLYLLPLPYNTRYEVSGNLELDKLLSKDTYLSENYYTFFYPDTLKDLTLGEKQEEVKEWYIGHTDGRMENGQFVITYLGIDYIISFDKKKVDSSTKTETDAFAISLK